MSFRITGLSPEPFQHLFALSDAELAARGAVRRIADRKPGFPCRISLTDPEPGQEVILTHFEHHPVASPYRASHAIYVRRGEQRYDAVDEVPEQLRLRLLSVRAFDRAGMLVDADVVDGHVLEPAIARLLGESAGGLPARSLRQARLLRRPDRPRVIAGRRRAALAIARGQRDAHGDPVRDHDDQLRVARRV